MSDDIFGYIILAAFGIATIYLIIKRIKDKKKENFEDREN